jgi:hypothetical protein
MIANRRMVMTFALCVLWTATESGTGQAQVTLCNGSSGNGYGPQDLINCADAGIVGCWGPAAA